MSVMAPRLGALLEPPSGPLGPSWKRHGPSWGFLGPVRVPCGALPGRLGAIRGASRAVLQRQEAYIF
eukprot:8454083-Pyramimonas_sp.AAC.1